MAERERHQQAAAEAIRTLLRQIRWKPNKAEQHLAKRKKRRHLATEATQDDYHSVIRTVLGEANNLVYRYPFGVRNYYAVTGQVEGVTWLVLFSVDGVLETAFPPKEATSYLATRGFLVLGRLEELLR